MKFNINKKAFIENGYCVIKNLLNENEVQYYDDKIKRLNQLGLLQKAHHLQLMKPVVIVSEVNEY